MVLTVSMGYGHLRAARPIASQLGVSVDRVDLPPYARELEVQRWQKTRDWYEWVSRGAARPRSGFLQRWLLNRLTDIAPREIPANLSAPSYGARYLKKLIEGGFGATLVEQARKVQRPVITTFYAVALMLEGKIDQPVYCVVTDTDVNRVWAPVCSRQTAIRYLAPCDEVAQRLYSYGVPTAQVRVTGFPLPDSLVGGRDRIAAKASLRRRLGRLDPLGTFARTFHEAVSSELGPIPEAKGPIQLMFAVGGAGAQAQLVDGLLPAVGALVDAEELTLVLGAGIRPRVREVFELAVRRTGLERHLGQSVRILASDSVDAYLQQFETELETTDVLLTKPSELIFYAAVGLPLILAPAVGVHEDRNRQWVTQFGAALDQPEIGKLGWWLRARLADGSLARAAWNGFSRLNATGVYAIVDLVTGGWGA